MSELRGDTRHFAEFLQMRSHNLLTFFSVNNKVSLVVNLPVFDKYHDKTTKLFSLFVESKRLDLEDFYGKGVTEELLININLAFHNAIEKLVKEKKLITYIELMLK